MIFGAVLAGGSGTRMGGGEKPKQYLNLGGKPVIIHTIERFCESPEFEKILVLCPQNLIDYTKEIISAHLSDVRVDVIGGGLTRNETLLKALEYIEENYGINDDDIILTHDAVRPFVTRRIIEENIKYTFEYGACDTAVPATDTIVESDGGLFIDTIPERKSMFQGQTPQSFNVKKLAQTVRSLTPEEEATLTDACKIFTIKGLPVYIVRGEVTNIKITYPFDLKVAETLLNERD
jgi:2-C-methyl-D-erythritol 4-phosphate cytidylyltransferase